MFLEMLLYTFDLYIYNVSIKLKVSCGEEGNLLLFYIISYQ